MAVTNVTIKVQKILTCDVWVMYFGLLVMYLALLVMYVPIVTRGTRDVAS